MTENKKIKVPVTKWDPPLRLDPPPYSNKYLNVHLNTCDKDGREQYTINFNYDGKEYEFILTS